jgi:hypothetical protein
MTSDEYIAANRALDEKLERLVQRKAKLATALRSAQHEDFVERHRDRSACRPPIDLSDALEQLRSAFFETRVIRFHWRFSFRVASWLSRLIGSDSAECSKGFSRARFFNELCGSQTPIILSGATMKSSAAHPLNGAIPFILAVTRTPHTPRVAPLFQ